MNYLFGARFTMLFLMGYKLLKNTPEIDRIYTHKFYELMGVELEHSRPIGLGFGNKPTSKNLGKVKDTDVMRKGIQHARWWWSYLRLALELEEKNIELVVKPSGTKKSGGGSGSALHIPRKTTIIKVEKHHYGDWDLDEVMENSFDGWWKNHRGLFQSTLPKIVDSKTAKKDKRHLLLEIDRTAPRTETIREIRKLLSTQMDAKMPYEVEGQVRVTQLTSRFNAVVCALEGMSPKEIMTHPKRYIRMGVKGVPFSVREGKYNYSAEFRKYYKGGIFHLLEVCKGRFGKGIV